MSNTEWARKLRVNTTGPEPGSEQDPETPPPPPKTEKVPILSEETVSYMTYIDNGPMKKKMEILNKPLGKKYMQYVEHYKANSEQSGKETINDLTVGSFRNAETRKNSMKTWKNMEGDQKIEYLDTYLATLIPPPPDTIADKLRTAIRQGELVKKAELIFDTEVGIRDIPILRYSKMESSYIIKSATKRRTTRQKQSQRVSDLMK